MSQYVLEDKNLLLKYCLIKITSERICYSVVRKQRVCRSPMFKHLFWNNQIFALQPAIVEEGSSYCFAAHQCWTCEVATASLFCFLPASLHCMNLILSFVLFTIFQRKIWRDFCDSYTPSLGTEKITLLAFKSLYFERLSANNLYLYNLIKKQLFRNALEGNNLELDNSLENIPNSQVYNEVGFL